MKAAMLNGPNNLVLEEVTIPEICDDEVLVEVKYCGICGSDLHSYQSGVPMGPGTYPGHEFSGLVAKVGRQIKGWKCGDRVTTMPTYVCGECIACKRGRFWECQHKFEHCIGVTSGRSNAGAFAKFVKVPIPDWRLYRLPEGVSFEEGALVESLSCSLHGIKLSGISIGEQAMVLGAGPIGLGVTNFLKNVGAGLIVVSETNEKRAELAKKLGADYVFNPDKVPNLKQKIIEITNGKGVDVVFDCSGVSQAFLSATGFLKYAGRVVLLGIIEKEISLPLGTWVRKEWQLFPCAAYGPDGFYSVIEFLKKGISPIKEIVTKKIKLSNIVSQGFDVLMKPSHSEIKILVEPD